MNKFEEVFYRIKRISSSNVINALHLQEECGELATEIMIQSGMINKISMEGIKGEAADVIISAMAVLANECDTVEEALYYLDSKVLKWESSKN